MTMAGYIKRMPLEEFTAQNRRGAYTLSVTRGLIYFACFGGYLVPIGVGVVVAVDIIDTGANGHP